MKILGLKMSRWREWLEVLKIEGRSLTWRNWLEMVRLGMTVLFFGDRKLWRDRMRTCRQCPIYNRSMHQCRLRTREGIYGCGCYCPVLAMTRGNHCWAREREPDGEEGWKK